MTKKSAAKKQNGKAPASPVALTDRRGPERRVSSDRRKRQIPVAVDRRKGDRRVGERRRQIDPTTCERDYNNEELEFMQAIESYKRDFRRPFPTWSEILEVVKAMGYRRVEAPTEIVANRAKAVIVDDAL